MFFQILRYVSGGGALFGLVDALPSGDEQIV
jgi:hypothetical protein